MEITSVCPYCGKEMRDGAIPVLRDIYWCPRGEDGMLKDGFGDEKEQVWLGRAGLLGDYYTPARYCESCKVVIVPVPEIEWPLDKLDKKFTASCIFPLTSQTNYTEGSNPTSAFTAT